MKKALNRFLFYLFILISLFTIFLTCAYLRGVFSHVVVSPTCLVPGPVA